MGHFTTLSTNLLSIVASRINAFCWSNPSVWQVWGEGAKLKQVVTKDDDVDCYDNADVLCCYAKE